MPGIFPLADIGGDIAPIVACLGVFMIPIVAILTAHQRKMALIFHGNRENQVNKQEQSDSVSAEVRELRQIVYQQSIAIDTISSKLDRLAAPSATPEVQQRLGGIEQ